MFRDENMKMVENASISAKCRSALSILKQILLLSLSFVWHFNWCIVHGESSQGYFNAKPNYTLQHPGFFISQVMDASTCGFLCLRYQPKCMAYNLRESGMSGFRCELLEANEYYKPDETKLVESEIGNFYYSLVGPCMTYPCVNGGSCHVMDDHVSFTCSCTPDFIGTRCEKGVTDYDVHFPTHSASDYVISAYNSPDMTSLTLSLWVKFDNTSIEDTMVSYAIQSQDDEFIFIKPAELHIYVGNDYAKSNVSIRDTEWHHLAVTWSSSAPWKMYKDGSKVFESAAVLKQGHVISGHGTVVLGQDQDTQGSGFDVNEAFAGYISQVNLWNYILPESKIVQLSQSCSNEEGNTWRWRDFRRGLRGSTREIVPSQCAKV